MPESQRKYDKGENRRKHQGSSDEAVVVWENGLEVGKCPKGFSLEQATTLLQDAIPEFKKRQPDQPFRLWNYYAGAVYQARTSDGGVTWHGWPVQAKHIPPKIERQLRERAESYGDIKELKRWLDRKF
jgi:hypothetical protein